MTPGDSPAVAILPYGTKPRGPLADVPLETLIWPLGWPERLRRGRIADMGAGDHLLIYPSTRIYFVRWGAVSARVSLMIVEPDAIHAKHLLLARLFRRRFHRILTKTPALLAALPNARRFIFGWSMMSVFLATPSAPQTWNAS